MTTHTTHRLSFLIGAALLAATLGGCPPDNTNGNGNSNTSKQAALRPFASESEFVSYFKNQAGAQAQSSNLRGGFLPSMMSSPEGGGAPTVADSSGGTGSNSSSQAYTQTNVQEEGVDESDVIKSDGAHFFIAKHSSLRIATVSPLSAMAEVGRIDVPDQDVYINAMYLLNGKVLLLGGKYGYYAMGWRTGVDDTMPMIWPPYYTKSTCVIYEVDVADATKPAITKTVELDGALVESRLTSGHLLLVLSIAPSLPDNPTGFNIAAMPASNIFPKAYVSGAESRLVSWPDIYRPESPDGYFMAAVVSLDAANIETKLSSTAVIGNASTIYASTNALYLTDGEYDPSDNYRERTAIHKFKLNADGSATYAASGSVPGRLLNQFSLSEHSGYLRTATHVDNFRIFMGEGDIAVVNGPDGTVSSVPRASATAADVAPSQPYNAVYVLGESAGVLSPVGMIENIAPGEKLYAARFLQNRGFLVTFVQIDPLFALDLADPTHPKIVGELKIPGYSDYLHPLDDTHLIGVGRAVSTSPWGGQLPTSVQLSLFDVSDLANPKLVQQVQTGGYGSWSDVSSTHKAFAFLPDSGLLGIPAELYPDNYNPYVSSYYTGPSFSGVLVYRVTTSGLESLGRVDAVTHQDYYGYHWTEWRRAAFIGDTVYALSPTGIRGAAVTDLSTTATVTLAPGPEDIAVTEGGSGDSGGGSTSPSSPGGG